MKTWGDVFGLGNQELVSELADVNSLENALAATRLTLLAEIDRRGLAMKLGHSSVTRWYARSVRITDGSAARQNALGYWLRDHHSVLDALADGRIHAAHAAAIAEGFDVVLVADSTLDEQRREAIVAELLDTAMRSTAGQVSSRAQALAHSAADDARARHENAEKRREQERQEQERREQERRDQTGSSNHAATSTASLPYPEPPAPEPVPPTPAPRPVSENPNLNRFDVHPLANGRFQFGGDVDRLLAEKLLTALSPLTAPRPGPGGERDPRSPSKRRADALDQILDRHLRGGSRGSASGSRASVHLIVLLRDLLAHGGKEQNVSATTDSMGTRGVATSSSNGGAGRDTVGSGGDAVRHEDNDRIGGTGARPDGTGARPDVAARGNMDALGDAAAGGNCAGQRSAPEPGDASACGEAAAAGGGAGPKSAPEPGDADWPFNLDWTGPISRTLAELLTCDADLTPVIVDDHGVPLALGRTTRLASDDQRIALTIRDTCCVMCGRPAQWCQAHHVKFWEHGGRTDLNNLALVCGECHRLVHHGDWKLIMGDDGHPYSIPPESIDPRRQPIPSYHRRKRRAA
ncbi:HNH endonuclease signature motif containing protein [Rhodococcus sp. IEGM 1381]|uniref:HNH endonuclease signature motif containing protein n=1 Tax=Rhodococcus sp. IEGM 1381 TaxID=3047085 RepID=UPI0024B76971|nr:HNH endonuclease signature motif containing protein [Rhodococcus sp. IEGM 1381]MDI9897968.1 HNH endonuclease signature motif containing protein [Rhodococcus sp. IEGM 1381]